MRVYINARFLTQSITGVQRYAIEMVKELDRFIVDNQEFNRCEWILIAPKNIKYELKLKRIALKKQGLLSGHAWEQIELPVYSRDGFLINLCNTAPILKKEQSVTIHDAAVYACPDGFSVAFRMWYKFLYWWLGKRIKNIITDSNFSKNELLKHYKSDKQKIKIIYLGLDHIREIQSNHCVLDRYGLNDRNFVFAVSSMNPNKNFKIICEAARKNSDILYVIAGGTNHRVFSQEELRVPNNMKYIGYVTDEELVALYRKARCFIYPSLYEGFGLPPLEAMACGCPTIVSNRASLPEICGDASLYCDPLDVDDVLKSIETVFYDEVLWISLKEKGLKNIRKFSWKNSAESLYRIILSQ